MTTYDPNQNPFTGQVNPAASPQAEPSPAAPPAKLPRTDRVDRSEGSAYRDSAKQIEQVGRSILAPLQLFGSGLKGFMSELLGNKTVPFAGSAIAVFGLALATESYWVGLGNGHPFIPKLGFTDGANLANLQAILTGSPVLLWQFFLVFAIALVCQLAEALPIRAALGGKARGRKGRSPLAWGAVTLCYAIDVYCAHATYLSHAWSIPGLVWMLVTILGAELGLALAKSA